MMTLYTANAVEIQKALDGKLATSFRSLVISPISVEQIERAAKTLAAFLQAEYGTIGKISELRFYKHGIIFGRSFQPSKLIVTVMKTGSGNLDVIAKFLLNN